VYSLGKKGTLVSSPPGIGPHYQQATKYARQDMAGLGTWAQQVPAFKQYENPLEVISLPEPAKEGGLPLWQVIASRRTVRDFLAEPMPLAQLSQLLWAIQGFTGEAGERQLRASASAGALYPNETYLFINNVADCPVGIFHYQVREHALAHLAEGHFGPDLSRACLEQGHCAVAPVVFAWGAVVDRCAWKYGDRAYRYIYMDAGHLGAQLQLAAAALGLGSVNIGAFFDDEVNELLGLDGQRETVVYLTAVGSPM
jgi:SagB-type dehydrogenase family enzyme